MGLSHYRNPPSSSRGTGSRTRQSFPQTAPGPGWARARVTVPDASVRGRGRRGPRLAGTGAGRSLGPCRWIECFAVGASGYRAVADLAGSERVPSRPRHHAVGSCRGVRVPLHRDRSSGRVFPARRFTAVRRRVRARKAWYLTGRKAGPAAFNKPGSRLFRSEYADRAHEFFEKHGRRSVILARFVPLRPDCADLSFPPPPAWRGWVIGPSLRSTRWARCCGV
jgi:hypothetical protein